MDLRARVLSALRWSAVGRFGVQLISWSVTILVIRVLTPADYGLLAMATVLTSFLIALNDIGLDAVLVQKRDLTESDRQHIFGVILAINVLICGLLLLGAPRIAGFYGEPRLTPIVRVLALQFLIVMFDTLPQARLERELDFKGRTVIDMLGTLSGSLATALLAFRGFGVWALVWGMLLTSATRTIGLNWIAGCVVRPKWSLAAVRRHLAFGSFVSGYRASFVVFSESDKFIGGKLLGKETLGYYAVAAHVASLPIQKLAGVLQAVAFPAFAHASGEQADVRGHLLKATRVMSIVAFPMFLGISVVAPELVLLLLGPAWDVAIVPLQVLALIMPLRMLSALLTPLLIGLGRPGVNATNQLLAVVVMAPLFVVGAQRGAIGLAVAWLVGYPALFAISVWRACRAVGIAPAQYFDAMGRPLLLGLLMYSAIWVLRPVLVDSSDVIASLALLFAAGVGIYAAGLLTLHRAGLAEMTRLLH